MDKLTKQGVRDLDAKFGRVKRPKADDPPKQAFVCHHARVRRLDSGDTYCLDCPTTWDWNGMPYND